MEPPLERPRLDEVMDLQLANVKGEKVTIRDLKGRRNLLLVFYRADWCPYCSGQLSVLSSRYSEFRKHDTEIVAVSADEPELGRELALKLNLPFQVLSDTERRTIELMGVLDEEEGMAKPAALLFDREGRLRYSYVGADYADRPATDEILEEVRKLDG